MTKPFPADDRTSCRLPSIPTFRRIAPDPTGERFEVLHRLRAGRGDAQNLSTRHLRECLPVRRTGAGQSGPHVHPGFLHQSPVAPHRSRRKAWLRHRLPRSSRGQAPRKQENDGPWPQSLCPRSPGRPPFRSSRRTSAPYARIPSCTLARCPVLPSRSTIPVGRRR